MTKLLDAGYQRPTSVQTQRMQSTSIKQTQKCTSRSDWVIKDTISLSGQCVDTPTGIECGMRGHRGPNGSRGNPNSLRNLGRKCNIGHSHTAAILDGIYVAGISCGMDLGYNKGPSSWSQSHIVTYPNAKRAIITMKSGKWRA